MSGDRRRARRTHRTSEIGARLRRGVQATCQKVGRALVRPLKGSYPEVGKEVPTSPHVVLTPSRSTAPSAVRGRASVNTTTCGLLKRAILDATKSLTCWAVYSLTVFTSTTALTASPHRASGTPYTHTPLTPVICMMTVSTSAGYTFSPPVLINSFSGLRFT